MIKKLFTLSTLIIAFIPLAYATNCDQAITTIENNTCLAQQLAVATKQMDQYIAKAKARFADQPKVIASIEHSQQNWLLYRQSHCDSVYAIWSDGTIRGTMFGECMLKLTKQRTYQVWVDYLTYIDNTPPLLPEPK